MPVGGQLRTDQTTGLHADHNITNAALELTRLHPFSLANEMANETPECCDAQAVVAVGTRIAPRSPHRSRRALLTHRSPPSVRPSAGVRWTPPALRRTSERTPSVSCLRHYWREMSVPI